MFMCDKTIFVSRSVKKILILWAYALPFGKTVLIWISFLFAVRYINKIWHMFITFSSLIYVKVWERSSQLFVTLAHRDQLAQGSRCIRELRPLTGRWVAGQTSFEKEKIYEIYVPPPPPHVHILYGASGIKTDNRTFTWNQEKTFCFRLVKIAKNVWKLTCQRSKETKSNFQPTQWL